MFGRRSGGGDGEGGRGREGSQEHGLDGNDVSSCRHESVEHGEGFSIGIVLGLFNSTDCSGDGDQVRLSGHSSGSGPGDTNHLSSTSTTTSDLSKGGGGRGGAD